jgi:hypothetical protein
MPWNTIRTQAGFFIYECKKYYPGLWRDLTAGTKSVETLTANIMVIYERPSAQFAALDTRIKYAREFLAQWVPDKPAPPIATVPGPASDTAARRSAVLANLASLRASLLATLATYTSTINAEVAILDATKADFEGLSPISPAGEVLAQSKVGTMNGSKAAITSTGMWGPAITIITPLLAMIIERMGHSTDPNVVMAGMIFGALLGAFGRAKATDKITGIIKP